METARAVCMALRRNDMSTEEALCESELRYRTLVETMNEGLMVLGNDRTVSFVNDKLCAMLGHVRGEMLGRSAFEFFDARNSHLLRRLLDSRSKAEPDSCEIEITGRNGNQLASLISTKPLYDKHGYYDGSFVVVLDLTRRKASETLVTAQRDFSIALTDISDLHSALRISVDTALSVSQMDTAVLFLAKDGGNLDLTIHEGLSDEFLHGVSRFDSDSELTTLIFAGKPAYFTAGRPALPGSVGRLAHQEGWRAIAIIPVVDGGQVIAAFIFASRGFDHLSIQEQRFLEAIAAQTGTALARIKAEQALQENEVKYTRVIQDAAQAILVIQDGVIRFLNSKALDILGYSEDALLAKPFSDFVNPEGGAWATDLEELMNTRTELPPSATCRVLNRQGDAKWLQLDTVVINWDGRPAGLTLATDITERKAMEAALRESEQRYRLLAENSMTGIYTHQKGVFTYVNQRLADMIGYSTEELVGQKFWKFVHPDDRDAIKRRGLAISRGERLNPYVEFRVLCKNGETKWFQVLSTPVTYQGHTANLGNVADITKRKIAEERVRQSLRQKEVLLREIHHRVRNNLAIINSFVGLQSESVPDHAQRKAFEELQSRIRSMALAHEFVYQSEDLAAVNVADYVQALVDHLVTSTGILGNPVEFTEDMAGVAFELDTAIPFGFLLTELVSNCLKHAFPHGRGGHVKISLRSIGVWRYELIVSDNGVGIPADISREKPTSLGLQLVNALVRQLNGEMEIQRTEGTDVIVQFMEAGNKSLNR